LQVNPDEQKARVRTEFDRLAPEYDPAPGCFAYFGVRLVEFSGVAPGHSVLDVACGRGAVLFPAADRAGRHGAAVGIDISESMIEAAHAEATRRGVVVDLRPMDAERLTFPDGTFDRVLCGFGIMFLPAQQRALEEFGRVLKPGGGVGLSTWKVSQADVLQSTLHELGYGGPPEPGWITDGDRLRQLIEGAGFSNVTVIADPHEFRYDSLEQYWNSARATGLRRYLDILDDEQRGRVRAALSERLRPWQRPNGIYVEATALLAMGEP
jgi:ubiquinone/menaquinone biosynthesis C-methylase UbiE